MIVKILSFSLVIVLGIGITNCQKNDYKSWKPKMPELPAILILEASWGEDAEIGFHSASQTEGDFFNDGFTNFAVKNKRIYIADTFKRQISVFENGKIARLYPYNADIHVDLGLAVSDSFLYLLDDKGYLYKIDSKSGDYLIKKLVAVENTAGVLPLNKYTIYDLNETIVLNNNYNLNRCFSAYDLGEILCPFVPKDDPTYTTDFIYLPKKFYAAIKGTEAWLHGDDGKIKGKITGINKQLLYDVRRSYHVELEGIYFIEHTKTKVRFYFKPWQK